MKMIAKMTGQQYRAAYECRANKDVRYYLNGIHINTEHDEVVTTNGHIMYVAKIEMIDESVHTDFIFEGVKILASVTEVEVHEYDSESILLITIDRNFNKVQHVCKLIDGRFPAYKEVINSNGKNERKPYTEFSFDATYVNIIQKVFGKVPVHFDSPNNNSAFRVSVGDTTKGLMIMMPCKV